MHCLTNIQISTETSSRSLYAALLKSMCAVFSCVIHTQCFRLRHHNWHSSIVYLYTEDMCACMQGVTLIIFIIMKISVITKYNICTIGARMCAQKTEGGKRFTEYSISAVPHLHFLNQCTLSCLHQHQHYLALGESIFKLSLLSALNFTSYFIAWCGRMHPR